MSKSILLVPMLIVLTFVVVVVLLALLLFGGGGGGDDDGTSASGADKPAETQNQPARESKQGTITAGGLKVGDCISDATSRTGDVTTFDGVKCDERHNGEVYTLITLGGDEAKIPSEGFINGKGQRGCRARLKRQTTARQFRDRQLGFKFVYPTPESWAEGDRDITCVATFKKPRARKLARRS